MAISETTVEFGSIKRGKNLVYFWIITMYAKGETTMVNEQKPTFFSFLDSGLTGYNDQLNHYIWTNALFSVFSLSSLSTFKMIQYSIS